MTLYLIGIGLADEKDITVKGLDIVKNCDLVYLENYTSLLQCTVADLEQFYGKKIILADREKTEQGDQKIIEEAKDKDVAFLVIGDPFSATTHIDLYKLAQENEVEVKVIDFNRRKKQIKLSLKALKEPPAAAIAVEEEEEEQKPTLTAMEIAYRKALGDDQD